MNNEFRDEITLKYGHHEVYCQVNGEGEELLIAFPGYGRTVDFYSPALPLLIHKYTTWIIDLPLHGKTTWNEPMFTIKDFTEIILLILQQTGQLRFSLLGHSFGGRAVLTQIPVFGKKLNQVFLLAPDGIKNPGLMTVGWIPGWLRRLTSGWVEQSHRLLPCAEWLHRRGWMASDTYRFAEFYLKTKERRQQVKMYWLSLADFQVDLSSVKNTIKTNQITTVIFIGKRDKIIPSDVGTILASGIESWVKIMNIKTGHSLNGGAVLESIKL